MNAENGTDRAAYRVVVNDELQYSICRADHPNPSGWNDGGVTGLKSECIAYIERVWTDMRPLSVRLAMDRSQAT